MDWQGDATCASARGMTIRPPVVALIVAAGAGLRAGGDLPKQFVSIAGRPMLVHACAAFARHPGIDRVMVVVAAGDCDRAAMLLGPTVTIVAGGATRRESVARGLAAVSAAHATVVLVHDAARPFVPAAVIDRILAALEQHGGAIPVLAAADTLARGDATLGDVVPRAGIVRVQTPQGFRVDRLLAAHAAWPVDEEATDDAQMVRRLGGTVALVQGDPMLEKVTYPEDFAAAEARLPAKRAWRPGSTSTAWRRARNCGWGVS